MLKTIETTDAVILEPREARSAVIWLHGLGADGHDFEPIVDELNFPAKAQTRFIFPHAPQRPVTLNGGYVMRAWYDIVAIDPDAPEDEAGIRESASSLEKLLRQQIATGIPANRIVLAGFSQGGAVALHAGLRQTQALAGIMALSTYLPLGTTLPAELAAASKRIPVFMAHGRFDDVVPLQLAEVARTALNHWQYKVEWHSYPMPHSVCAEEVNDVSRWLSQVLP